MRPGDAVVGGTDFSRGQRGSYADTVVVREDQLITVPPGLDITVAAALPVAGVTAWRCIVDVGRLGPGRRALVLGGSGGGGRLARPGAPPPAAPRGGGCSTRNIDRVRALGADTVLDYTQGDPLAQARALAPFQVVLDCVGGHAGAACRSLLGPGGRHVMIAAETVGETLNILVPPFSSKSVLGRPNAARLRSIVDAVARGDVTVNVCERMPLAEAERALELSKGGRLTGKIVLIP